MANEIGSGILSGIFGIANSVINNVAAGRRAQQDRLYNYEFNEKAAENADKRTRNLYNDFYSPEALLRQYEAAGLSPSMMFGGTPGQGGMSGAQGAGTAGIQTPYMPNSILEAAQVANLMAQTKKTNEESKNIAKDTEVKELERKYKELETSQYETQFKILNSTWVDAETGEATSLFEMAKKCYSYDEFLNDVRKNGEKTDPTIYDQTRSEQGQKVLREIYTAASTMSRDIMVLSAETVSASFQIDVVNALQNEKYPEMNAKAAIQELKTSISTNELTESQKDAWNNLLDKLGSKGSTWRDIVIVLGMILGNYAGKVGIKVNTGDTFVTNKS